MQRGWVGGFAFAEFTWLCRGRVDEKLLWDRFPNFFYYQTLSMFTNNASNMSPIRGSLLQREHKWRLHQRNTRSILFQRQDLSIV